MPAYDVYREIMITAYVEKQVQNYKEEGWPTDEIDPTFRNVHILDPLRHLLKVTDEEEEKIIEVIDSLL